MLLSSVEKLEWGGNGNGATVGGGRGSDGAGR